ncbi:unnamed protein product [Phytomonas sp. Hart1]|nr:unnamed protein product [Phytomonas sp. Hart1]|eukprot:CCW66142.1 unnamed protein product [Phytomonas sp. isolate Hart1]
MLNYKIALKTSEKRYRQKYSCIDILQRSRTPTRPLDDAYANMELPSDSNIVRIMCYVHKPKLLLKSPDCVVSVGVCVRCFTALSFVFVVRIIYHVGSIASFIVARWPAERGVRQSRFTDSRRGALVWDGLGSGIFLIFTQVLSLSCVSLPL